MSVPSSASKARVVACPRCGGPSLYTLDNAYRPFCSPRCKTQDFGAWASESYRVPTKQDPGDEEVDDTKSPEH